MRCLLLAFAPGLFLVTSPATAGGPEPATPQSDAAALEKRAAELERQLAELRKEIQELHRRQRAAADGEGAARPAAWGKAANGLQAGLALRPAGKRSFAVGESARFVVTVRNGGDRPVELRYLSVEAAARVGPSVLDAGGKRPPLSGPVFRSVGGRAISKLALAPGEEAEFATPELTFGPVGESRVQEKATVQGGPGKYRVSYHVNCVNPDDTGNYFTTGEVDVDVVQPPEK
jgi:hypothetical protein